MESLEHVARGISKEEVARGSRALGCRCPEHERSLPTRPALGTFWESRGHPLNPGKEGFALPALSLEGSQTRVGCWI
jgi:hypothetical protein